MVLAAAENKNGKMLSTLNPALNNISIDSLLLLNKINTSRIPSTICKQLIKLKGKFQPHSNSNSNTNSNSNSTSNLNEIKNQNNTSSNQNSISQNSSNQNNISNDDISNSGNTNSN